MLSKDQRAPLRRERHELGVGRRFELFHHLGQKGEDEVLDDLTSALGGGKMLITPGVEDEVATVRMRRMEDGRACLTPRARPRVRARGRSGRAGAGRQDR